MMLEALVGILNEAGQLRGDPNGYNWITLDGDRLSIEVRGWRSGHFMPLRTTEYLRDERGWRPGAEG